MPVATRRSVDINNALVVSPYGVVQAMIKIHLGKHDVDADLSSAPREAISALRSKDYDIVVLELVKEAMIDKVMRDGMRDFIENARNIMESKSGSARIAVLSALSKDEFMRDYKVDVDLVLDKRANWYGLLSDYIAPEEAVISEPKPDPDRMIGGPEPEEEVMVEEAATSLNDNDGQQVLAKPRKSLEHSELL